MLSSQSTRPGQQCLVLKDLPGIPDADKFADEDTANHIATALMVMLFSSTKYTNRDSGAFEKLQERCAGLGADRFVVVVSHADKFAIIPTAEYDGKLL